MGPWFKARLGSLGVRLLGEAGHLGERRALAVAVRATVAHEDECAAGDYFSRSIVSGSFTQP